MLTASAIIPSAQIIMGSHFLPSGVFTTTGIQTIILKATGTIIADGVFDYDLTEPGGTSCSFSVTFLPPPTVNAVYTVGGASGVCTGAVLNGTYTPGIPMDASNTLTIEVIVSTPGFYSMNSGVANGISFSGSGILSTTGLHTITLTASGTPIFAEVYDYSFSSSTSACGYLVEFGSNYLSASFNGTVVKTFNDNVTAVLNVAGGVTKLTVTGNDLSAGTEELQIQLQVTGTINPGFYTINQAAAGTVLSFSYTDANGIMWGNTSDISTTQQPLSGIQVETITTGVGGRVRARVFASLKENGIGPATKSIVYGDFNLPLH